jgi:hypothetical protein
MPVTNEDVIKWMLQSGFGIDPLTQNWHSALGTGITTAMLKSAFQLAFDAGYSQRDKEFGESEAERCPI